MEDILPQYAAWNDATVKIAIACFAIGLLIAVAYFIRMGAISDSKSKYDFIVKSEVKTLWSAAIFLILGGAFLANSNITVLSPIWIFVRVFTTAAMGMIVALIVQNLLKFYYPFYIEKRLKALRLKPRISPKTGKPMKLLSEEEEDAYLDEGMQAEENVFSMDYDVWKDEETGYIKIEKYSGHLHAIECPKCNYQTFKVVREEVVKQPEGDQAGEVLKHYECSYCRYRVAEAVPLLKQAKFEEPPSTPTTPLPSQEDT